MDKESLMVDGSDYFIDLGKLFKVDVVSVHGYMSNEFDEPVFKITRINLSDGTSLHVEGEHDMPYISRNKITREIFDAAYELFEESE